MLNLQHNVAGAQHHAARLGFVHVGVHDADFRSMKDCRLDKEKFCFIGLHEITSPDAYTIRGGEHLTRHSCAIGELLLSGFWDEKDSCLHGFEGNVEANGFASLNQETKIRTGTDL